MYKKKPRTEEPPFTVGRSQLILMRLMFAMTRVGAAAGDGKFAQYIVIGMLQSDVSGAVVWTLNCMSIARPSSEGELGLKEDLPVP